MIKNISVIGAGTMGNGIAHVFAQYGFAVTLIDVNPSQLQRALVTITKNLDRQVAKAIITEEQKAATLHNITMLSHIPDGVKDAQLIVEAATEDIDLKLARHSQIKSLQNSHEFNVQEGDSIFQGLYF